MSKISVVIPCYQQGQYLESAIESAYNQTLPAHEIIIVNDGSTDNTREIAERYMFKEFPLLDSPVRVINQVNKGLSSARNTGIMNATGDYVLFLDADDMLAENALQVLTQKILETNCDVISPSFREFGVRNQDVILQQFSEVKDLVGGNRLGYFSAIRRSVLLEVGGYSPRMNWGWEDWHIWFDIFTRGKSLAVIPDILVYYRVKETSMITVANSHSGELAAQIQRDFNYLFK